MKQQGIAFVVADEDRELVEQLREAGQAAVLGNAAEPATLIQAHVAEARLLVIATPQTVGVRQMVDTARSLNPKIEVLIRSHNVEEAKLLEGEFASTVFVGERELAQAMTRHVLAHLASKAAPAH